MCVRAPGAGATGPLFHLGLPLLMWCGLAEKAAGTSAK